MTYLDILKTAIGMVGEVIESYDNSDYEECSPYLLATFCRECASADQRYRQAFNPDAPTPKIPKVACVDLADTFPLSDVLAPAASYYLASMLVADENDSLSDRFFSLYTDAVASLLASLPTVSTSVVDRYQLL